MEQREQWETGVYTVLRIDPEESVVQPVAAVLSLSGKTIEQCNSEQTSEVQPLYAATPFPVPPEEEDEIEWQQAWDDVTGAELNPK